MYCSDSRLEKEPTLEEQWELSEEKLESSVEQRRKESPSPLPPPSPPKIQLSSSTKNLVNPEYVKECRSCLDKQCDDREEMMYCSKAFDNDNEGNIVLTHLEPFHEAFGQAKLHESYHNEEKCKVHSCDGLSRSLFTDNDARTTNSYIENENNENCAYWKERSFLHEQNLFLCCQENIHQLENCLFKEITNKDNEDDDDGRFEHNNQRDAKPIMLEYQCNQYDNKKSAAIDWSQKNKFCITESSVHNEGKYEKETRLQKDKGDNTVSGETKHDKAFSKMFTVIKRLERFAESNRSDFDNTHVMVGDKKKVKKSNELIRVLKTRNLVSVQVAKELLDKM